MASSSAWIAASALGKSGAKPPSSPDRGRESSLIEDALERVVGLGTPAQGLAKGRRTDRHDHELLKVDRVFRVRAAIDDIHHRHRQNVGIDTAEILKQRQVAFQGGGFGRRQRDRQDGVGTESGLVGGAVQIDHRVVHRALIFGVIAL